MTSFKLTIEYDGTDFCGWQSQQNGRAVQDVIEAAIAQVVGEKVRIAGAGRTDAGVHATGQVASFSVERDLSPAELRRSLNGVLPADVIVKEAQTVPPDFHARFKASSRTYTYTVLTSPTALRRRTAWSVGWQLNTSYLTNSAAMFVGTHNFRSFSKTGSEVTDWTCSVRTSEWRQTGPELIYTIEANRFLYGMVRALVGTMVEVARGYRPPSDIERIIAGEDRSLAGMAAPPHGLCLVGVSY